MTEQDRPSQMLKAADELFEVTRKMVAVLEESSLGDGRPKAAAIRFLANFYGMEARQHD